MEVEVDIVWVKGCLGITWVEKRRRRGSMDRGSNTTLCWLSWYHYREGENDYDKIHF